MIGMIDGPMLVGIAALITSIVNGAVAWRARHRKRVPTRRANGTIPRNPH